MKLIDKELQRYWYQKLKESGFEDIETDQGFLKKEVGSSTKERAISDREAREIYYASAAAFLHAYSFETLSDYRIWSSHVEGKSLRETALQLGFVKGFVEGRMRKMKHIFRFYLKIRSED